jgi:hypothetical protein
VLEGHDGILTCGGRIKKGRRLIFVRDVLPVLSDN